MSSALCALWKMFLSLSPLSHTCSGIKILICSRWYYKFISNANECADDNNDSNCEKEAKKYAQSVRFECGCECGSCELRLFFFSCNKNYIGKGSDERERQIFLNGNVFVINKNGNTKYTSTTKKWPPQRQYHSTILPSVMLLSFMVLFDSPPQCWNIK